MAAAHYRYAGEAFAHHALRRQDKQAIGYLRRWLELIPWDEQAHQYLMLLLWRSGNRAAALAQYDTCRQMLGNHLDAHPDQAIETLRTAIKNHQTGRFQDWIKIRPTHNFETGPSHPLRCPYPGLAAFTEKESLFFFGREVFVNQLLGHLKKQPLVTVVGSSSSGKSSVVQAGLLPQLRRAQDDGLTVVTIRPGSDPFQALTKAQKPHLASSAGSVYALARWLRQKLTLKPPVDKMAGNRLLLVIDQFEELYTLSEDEQTQTAFVQMLLHELALNPQANGSTTIQIVPTLRADFMEQVLAYRPLANALQPGLLLLGLMAGEELRRAIEQPAHLQAMQFEPGLVARLQQDIDREPGCLPLWQFVLTRLWNRATTGQKVLTHKAYIARD